MTLSSVLFVLGMAAPASAQETHHRSPTLAAALSLTPLPVDFGGIYAGNSWWAAGYTSAEVAIAGAMLFLDGKHTCIGGVGCSPLSDANANALAGFAVGYVGVKIVSAIHALIATNGFNAREVARWQPAIMPRNGGVGIVLARNF